MIVLSEHAVVRSWPLGVVEQMFTISDLLVRSADVRTAKETPTRQGG